MRCSHCGKWICADLVRCPKCGNYTDGLGPYQDAENNGRRIPRVFVIAAWLVIIGLLLPIVLALLGVF